MLRALRDIVFPPTCMGCKLPLLEAEDIVCTRCRMNLPMALLHENKDLLLADMLYGRVPIELSTTLFYYGKGGIVQALIHELKYRGQEQISAFLGRWLGAALQEYPAWQEVNIVIPIPVHARRRRQRGYNQVHGFAKEVAKALHAQLDEKSLVKSIHTSKQAQRKLTARQDDALNPFQLINAEAMKNRHVLIVDDVATSGATLEKACSLFMDVPGVTISIATMAIAD